MTPNLRVLFSATWPTVSTVTLTAAPVILQQPIFTTPQNLRQKSKPPGCITKKR